VAGLDAVPGVTSELAAWLGVAEAMILTSRPTKALAGAQATGAQATGAQATGAQAAGAHAIGAHAAGMHAPGTQEVATHA
jgi:hypothetical protein